MGCGGLEISVPDSGPARRSGGLFSFSSTSKRKVEGSSLFPLAALVEEEIFIASDVFLDLCLAKVEGKEKRHREAYECFPGGGGKFMVRLSL